MRASEPYHGGTEPLMRIRILEKLGVAGGKGLEKKTITLYKKRFDDIRHEENGIEFWYARELMELLEYAQ